MAAGAPHPHDVPRIDDLAPVAGEVDHAHLGLTRGGVLVDEDCRGEPVGVMTVADEGGSARDAIAVVGRRRGEWAAELGGDHDVRSAAVDLLGSLVGKTATEEGPVQRVLQGPRCGGVVATDLLTDEGAGDRVGLQPAERAGSCHSQQARLPQCFQDRPGQASLPLGFLAVLPDDRSDLACGVEQRGVGFPRHWVVLRRPTITGKALSRFETVSSAGVTHGVLLGSFRRGCTPGVP